MIPRRVAPCFVVGFLLASAVIPVCDAQQAASGTVRVVELTGLPDVKDNTKGTLSVESGQLHFVDGKANPSLSAASIQDVVTGNDSRRSIGEVLGTMSMAAPYGSGRFLSLFRTKIDTLTIQYRDADGGLHGIIFTMPAGTADGIKKELVAQGAHTTVPTTSAPAPSSPAPTGERKR